MKIDRRRLAMARELRDRWLECQASLVNERPAKHDVRRIGATRAAGASLTVSTGGLRLESPDEHTLPRRADAA